MLWKAFEEATHASGHGYAWAIADIPLGGGDVEPVVLSEFGSDESGHGRFARKREDGPNSFEKGTCETSLFQADAFGYGGDALSLQ